MLDGWVAQTWSNYQASIWKGGRSHNSSHQWTMIELIEKQWNIAWDMWEHQNGVLHHCLQVQQQILKSQANNQIWAYYAQGPQALLQDAKQALYGSTHRTPVGITTCHQAAMVRISGISHCPKNTHDFGNYQSEQWFMIGWVLIIQWSKIILRSNMGSKANKKKTEKEGCDSQLPTHCWHIYTSTYQQTQNVNPRGIGKHWADDEQGVATCPQDGQEPVFGFILIF